MDSVVEVQRQTHEELERLERALYTVLSRNLPTHEPQLKNAHIASELLSRVDSRAHTLHALYADEEARKVEIEQLGGAAGDDLGEFYKRHGKIQDHYAKYHDALPISDGFQMKLRELIEGGNEIGDDYDDYEEEDRAWLHTHPSLYHSQIHSSYIVALLRRRDIRKIYGPVH